MKFDDLSERQRREANAAIRAIVVAETERGLQRINDENEARAVAKRAPLTNGRLAGLTRWPTRLQPDPYSSQVGETIRGAGDKFYVLERTEIGYLDTRAQWGAKGRVIDLLKSLGLNELEAERELVRWFLLSCGVVAAIRAMHPELGDHLLIGARSSNVGSNVGSLSTPGGLVKPTDSLIDALIREAIEEVPGIRFRLDSVKGSLEEHGVFSFGSHNTAPSITFCASVCLGVDHGRDLVANGRAVKANREWVNETLVWVPEVTVKMALQGSLAGIKSYLTPHGIEVGQGFAADVVGPLTEQLDCWWEGYDIG